MARKKKIEVIEVIEEQVEEVIEPTEELNEAVMTHEPPKTVADMFNWKED